MAGLPLHSVKPADEAVVANHTPDCLWPSYAPSVAVMALAAAAFVAGTIGPNLKATLPRDLIEGFLWGRSFQLGYYKHPPLQAWLLGMAEHLASRPWWIAFALAQFCVAITIWAVWQLARSLLGEVQGAVAAALTLAGIYYYGMPTGTFTPDTLSLPLWALMVLFYWRAVGQRQPKYWYAFAITFALFMYSKYTGILLFATLGLLTIFTSEGRAALRCSTPWYAALLCLVLLSPHLVWLSNHSSPITYPLERLPAISVAERIWFSVKFVVAQLLNHIPLAVLLTILMWSGRGSPQLTVKRPILSRFGRNFMLVVALLPLLVVVALNIWSGVEFRHDWGSPLFAGSAILALMLLGPELVFRRLGVAFGVALAVVTVPHLANGVAPYLSSKPLWGAFPGREAADSLTAEYRKQTGTPLRIVIGDRSIAGVVAFYSADRPVLLVDAKFDNSPWVTPEMIQKEGALVVWPRNANLTRYKAALGMFEAEGRIFLPWRNRLRSPVVELEWAILPASKRIENSATSRR